MQFFIYLSFKQTLKFSSVEKLDNILTLLLESKIVTCGFSASPGEEHHYQQPSEFLLFFALIFVTAAMVFTYEC